MHILSQHARHLDFSLKIQEIWYMQGYSSALLNIDWHSKAVRSFCGGAALVQVPAPLHLHHSLLHFLLPLHCMVGFTQQTSCWTEAASTQNKGLPQECMIAQPAAAPYLLELVDACITNVIQILISKGTLAEQLARCLEMLTILFCTYPVWAGQTVWYSQRGAQSGQRPPVSL